jgi:hypothetical protein
VTFATKAIHHATEAKPRGLASVPCIAYRHEIIVKMEYTLLPRLSIAISTKFCVIGLTWHGSLLRFVMIGILDASLKVPFFRAATKMKPKRPTAWDSLQRFTEEYASVLRLGIT